MKKLKTLWLTLGIMLGVIIAAMFIIPLVVDVDKYRPMLLEQANRQINGKLDIGKLSLSLYGKVRVNIDGVKLSDAKGRPVVEVGQAEVLVPFMPLLFGAPEFKLSLIQPQLNVIKFKDGRMNVMTLVKETPKTEAAAGSTATAPGTPAQSPKQEQARGETQGLPAIALRAKLTFLLEHARLAYKDELSGDSYNINDLNFALKNISLDGDMPYELTAQLDLLAQQKIKLHGPLLLAGRVRVKQDAGVIKGVQTDGKLEMDQLIIKDPGMFDKAAGVPLGLEWQVEADKTSVSIPKFTFYLGALRVENVISAKINNQLGNETTAIDYKLKTNKIDIEKLGELVAMIRLYGVKGNIELSAQANGPTTKLEYASDIKFNGITLTSPQMLKQPLKVDGEINIITNKLKNMTVKMAANDFDVNINGMVENFLAPKFNFQVVSNNMDLDGLLVASEKAAQERKATAESKPGAATTAAVSKTAAASKPADFNQLLDPLRTNPIAAATSGSLKFGFKKIRTTGVLIDNLNGEFLMNNLAMNLKDLTLAIFGGAIKGNMNFNAKAAKPAVAVDFKVAGLNTQKMVESSFPFARNTVAGVISADLKIGGAGLNPDDVTSAWFGNGGMTILKARLDTMDIGPKIKNEAIGKIPEPIRSKVNVPESLAKWKGDYESLVMKWSLDKGIFTINEITGKAYPNKGMDLRGGGTINLKDYALRMEIDLIDKYNLMNGERLAKDKRYGYFTLPADVGNTMFDPKFNWDKMAVKLAQAALQGKAGEVLQKVAGKLPGKAGDTVSKLLGGGGGGGGGSAPVPVAAPAAPKQEDVKKALKGLFR